ncbi:MAG: sodium:solute symporter family protein [Polyangiaceae bacterium]
MIDLLLVLAFVAYAIVTGFQSRKDASLGPEQYFLAGRSMKGWKAGLSMSATQYAADTPLVVTGMIATAGVFALWRFWVYSFAFLLLGFLLAPAWRRAGIITDAELCETRYAPPPAEPLRYIKAVYFGTVLNCVILAMVLLAATRITEPFLPWYQWLPAGSLDWLAAGLEAIGSPVTTQVTSPDVWLLSASNLLSIVVIVSFTALYSTTGGLKSVIETDVIQVLIALVATGVYAWIVVSHVGGLSQIPVRLEELYGQARMESLLSFSPTEGAGAAGAILGLLGIQWLAQANSDGTGYLAQRAMSCHSDREAKLAGVIFTYVQSVVRTLLWLPIIVGLMILYPLDGGVVTGEAGVAVREATFIQGINEHLPPGALGIMMVGMLAALASTVDTHLNWGASYWTNDLYGRLYCKRIRKTEPDPKRQVWVARGSNLVVLAIALVIMLRLQSVQSAWRTSLLFGAGIGVPLLLRWVWHRQNAYGELYSIAASIVLAPVLLFGLSDENMAGWGIDADGADAIRLMLMALLSTVACVVGSLTTRPVPEAILLRFYEKVRPPGFWGPVAKRCDDDPLAVRRELYRGLAATFAAGFSVFCLIVGLGTWLLHAPGPSFMPRMLWIGLNVLAGLVLVVAWWRLAQLDRAPEAAPAVDPSAAE